MVFVEPHMMLASEEKHCAQLRKKHCMPLVVRGAACRAVAKLGRLALAGPSRKRTHFVLVAGTAD